MKAKVSGYVGMKGIVVLLGVLALILTTAGVALARIDEFGGASFSAAYAPYTAGPVVREEVRPYAPYTAGPVVREEPGPYAPYTAGPVVPQEGRTFDRLGHHLAR